MVYPVVVGNEGIYKKPDFQIGWWSHAVYHEVQSSILQSIGCRGSCIPQGLLQYRCLGCQSTYGSSACRGPAWELTKKDNFLNSDDSQDDVPK